MDVTQTSLEALLLKATNPQNLNIDTAAVEAFIALINKEKDGIYIGVKVLSNRLPTGNEKETLQTLQIIDICMNRCGQQFQSEIGKFRFLNEMIKLVSPKYLGGRTPMCVKQKVLQLLYLWTIDYPKETKIKEAYDMLKKQGVIRDLPNLTLNQQNTLQTTTNKMKKPTNSLFQDEEKSKVLQKLLQSKDPEDIQAANWLIKSMVKEDDKRAELKSKYISELESAQNNVRLLNEMLDTYKANTASIDEIDLIKELHQSCERLRPNIMKLATETLQGEEILRDALQINDELGHVFTKFNRLFGRHQQEQQNSSNSSLLQFDISPITSTTTINNKKPTDSITSNNNNNNNNDNNSDKEHDIDVLCDIFSTTEIPDCSNILQPTQLQSNGRHNDESAKMSSLEDLDVLSEHLFKENLISKQNSFKKNSDKIPMNLLTKSTNSQKSFDEKQQPAQQQQKLQLHDSFDLDLNCLINKHKEDLTLKLINNNDNNKLIDINDVQLLQANGDDNDEDCCQNRTLKSINNNHNIDEIPIKLSKLNDITIDIKDIKPSQQTPLILYNELDGVNMTLHFAKDKPKDDVYVLVVTTINKKQSPLENYMFQAIIPKECKLKLQPASATVLPAFNPFLPPAAITQILLIAAANPQHVFFKFVFSYTMGDETFTEMGEIECLPLA